MLEQRLPEYMADVLRNDTLRIVRKTDRTVVFHAIFGLTGRTHAEVELADWSSVLGFDPSGFANVMVALGVCETGAPARISESSGQRC